MAGAVKCYSAMLVAPPLLSPSPMLVAALIFLSLIASPAVQSFRNKYLGEQTDLSFFFFFFYYFR